MRRSACARRTRRCKERRGGTANSFAAFNELYGDSQCGHIRAKADVSDGQLRQNEMWFLVIAIRNEDLSTEYRLKSCQHSQSTALELRVDSIFESLLIPTQHKTTLPLNPLRSAHSVKCAF